MPRYAKPILREGQTCPYCATGTIVKRNGKYGDFMACDNYTRCAAVGRVDPQLNPQDIATQEWLLKNGRSIDPII